MKVEIIKCSTYLEEINDRYRWDRIDPVPQILALRIELVTHLITVGLFHIRETLLHPSGSNPEHSQHSP